MQPHQCSGASRCKHRKQGRQAGEGGFQLRLQSTDAEASWAEDHSMLIVCGGCMAYRTAVHTHHTTSPCIQQRLESISRMPTRMLQPQHSKVEPTGGDEGMLLHRQRLVSVSMRSGRARKKSHQPALRGVHSTVQAHIPVRSLKTIEPCTHPSTFHGDAVHRKSHLRSGCCGA